MLARTFNLTHIGVEIKASKFKSTVVTLEFAPSQFAPTRVNIIPRSFIHCQAKLGKLRLRTRPL